MKKTGSTRVLLLLLILLASSSMAATTNGEFVIAQSGDPWIVAIDQSYAPHEYWENGTAKGFNTDIIRAVSLNMDRPITWVPLPWADAYQALLNGTVESLCMAQTAERHVSFDFSTPILNLTLRIFVGYDVSGIFDIADLAEHTVAVEDGDISHIKLLELSPNATVVVVESQSEAIRLVAEGEVTAAFCNAYAGSYAILKNSYQNVKTVGNPLLVGTRAIAVLEGNTILRNQINEALDNIFDSGEYETIVERWFGTFPYISGDPGLGQALQTMGIFFLLSIIGVTVVLTWNRSLRIRVKNSTGKLELLGDLFRHDLRNIGQGAFSSLELLMTIKELDPQEKEILEMALSALKRADSLTTDYSAIEVLSAHGTKKIEKELSSSLKPVVQRIQQEYPSFNLNISYNHSADTMVIAVELLDEVWFRVLRFLIIRSIESGSENTIDFKTSVQDGYVMISIGNRGPGLPDDQKETALQRYKGAIAHQVGLDLSMVHAVVIASGGHVEIKNTVEGDWKKGLTFKIRLQIPSSNRFVRVFQGVSDKCKSSVRRSE